MLTFQFITVSVLCMKVNSIWSQDTLRQRVFVYTLLRISCYKRRVSRCASMQKLDWFVGPCILTCVGNHCNASISNIVFFYGIVGVHVMWVYMYNATIIYIFKHLSEQNINKLLSMFPLFWSTFNEMLPCLLCWTMYLNKSDLMSPII